jgi:hypothetical protein
MVKANRFPYESLLNLLDYPPSGQQESGKTNVIVGANKKG